MQKIIKKSIPYFFILILLAGFFIPTNPTNAQETTPADEPKGVCTGRIFGEPFTYPNYTKNLCDSIANVAGNTAFWDPYDETQTGSIVDGSLTKTTSPKSIIEENLDECGVIWSGTFAGCIKWTAYYIFYSVPSLLITVSAWFFNSIIAIALSSSLFNGSDFVTTAWVVVRDLANIFFIIILIYVAIEMILGLGGHGAKKTIASVIVMALLINFSMFFTKVVIDSSNILALVFYNKLNVTTNVNGNPTPYDLNTNAEVEKDMAGAMVHSFDPTKLLTQEFFDEAKITRAPDGTIVQEEKEVPTSIIVGMLILTGLIMGFAAYAFFMAGFAFLSRIIELWILIIFSPFAFMSSTLPIFSHIEYVGWSAWFKRLITVSFMAPIFMFFMYFIFLLIHSNIFTGFIRNGGSMSERILLVLLPAMMILVLLLQAKKFAKKGSGAAGEMVMSGAKMVGGLALGAATGGAALLATGTIGRKALSVANNNELREKAAGGDKGAQRKLAIANSLAKNSFDFRQTGLGKLASSKSGLNLDKGLGWTGLDSGSLKGGRMAQQDHAKEKEVEKMKTYELTAAGAARQNSRALEYERDKKIAQENIGEFRGNDEAEFKALYERGGNLSDYGINRNVKAGSVTNADDTNKDRRSTYANKLAQKHHDDEARTAVKTFFDEWKKGAKSALMSPASLGATAAIGVATGGLGVAGAAVALPFLHALKATLSHVHNTDPEVVAAVRKGEDKDKKLLKMIKEAGNGGDAHGGGHAAPAAPQAPTDSHGGGGHAAPVDSGHSDDHGGGHH